MSSPGYPPTHRNLQDAQPEWCDLCGLRVGGAHLTLSDVEGLRGFQVCDVHDSCRMRNKISYRDRRRWKAREHSVIGNSRVYPPGAAAFWNDD